MFIVIYRYIKPLADVDKIRPQHVAHFENHKRNNKVVCAGRLSSLTGGTCILRDLSRADVEVHVQTDPYVVQHVAVADIYEFEPTMCCTELAKHVKNH